MWIKESDIVPIKHRAADKDCWASKITGGTVPCGLGEDAYLWLRMGDAAEYEPHLEIASAADDIAIIIHEYCSLHGEDHEIAIDLLRPRRGKGGITGFEMPGFHGYNYISIFWGDDEAQIARGLTDEEWYEFVSRVEKALGVR